MPQNTKKLLQSGGNLAQREKCWKNENLAKLRKLIYWQKTAA